MRWENIIAQSVPEVETMAHLWLQNENCQWIAQPLSGSELKLQSFLVGPKKESQAAITGIADVLVLRTESDSQDEWSILSGQECRITINGIPLFLGIRILNDRDDIRWDRNSFAFYSSEEPAAVVSLKEGDQKLFCPRCKQEIAPGTPAVRCPGCGIWHHQSEHLPCYTYAENCATCTRKTALDNGYNWTPEEM